jgi:hypothetical protein
MLFFLVENPCAFAVTLYFPDPKLGMMNCPSSAAVIVFDHPELKLTSVTSTLGIATPLLSVTMPLREVLSPEGTLACPKTWMTPYEAATKTAIPTHDLSDMVLPPNLQLSSLSV